MVADFKDPDFIRKFSEEAIGNRKVEYTEPTRGPTWTYSENEITVKDLKVEPIELVDQGITWLEIAKEKSWKFLDARGHEIAREAILDEFIERLQNVRSETKN